MAERIHAEPVENAAGEKLTFEEFLRRYDGQHAEWIDGDVLLIMPPSVFHQQIAGFLHMLFSAYLDFHPLGKIFATINMCIVNQTRGREPDLMFIATEHLDRLKENYLEGPADLVIEIVSPESERRDRVTKFEEYEAGSVPEYWLIDPTYREVLGFQLGADRQYHRVQPDANGDIHSSTVKGFRLLIEMLWRDPLPSLQQVLEIAKTMVDLTPRPPLR